MTKAEMLNKTLYRVELYLIKTMPIVMCCIAILSTTLSYYDIDIPILSYIGGVSLLELLFMYVSSFEFKFCIYHRLPIHYLTIIWIVNIVDEFFRIPVTDKEFMLIHLIVAGIFIILMLYFKQSLK